MADNRGKHKSVDKSSYQKLLKSCCSFFLLLLVFLLDVCLLELRSVGITLHLPLAVLVLLELALLEELVQNVFCFKSLLRLGLLDCKFVLKLFVLALKFIFPFSFAKFLFLQISELGSSTSAL